MPRERSLHENTVPNVTIPYSSMYLIAPIGLAFSAVLMIITKPYKTNQKQKKLNPWATAIMANGTLGNDYDDKIS